MSISLLETFCYYHPEFLESLEVFSQDTKKKILKKLKNEMDRNNFRSAIAEIQFGELFLSNDFQIEYEKAYFNKQTPDWTIGYRESLAICDVYRLGQSETCQMKSDFENILRDCLEQLKYNYYLKMYFINENLDFSLFNPKDIAFEVGEWLLSSKKQITDKVLIQENFEFEIAMVRNDINHICCYGNASSINKKTEKLVQVQNLKPNEITKKLTKYKELISKEELPYFIAVSLDFISGFNHKDFIHYFLGKEYTFIDFDTPLANLGGGKELGKTWTELGEFYQNPQLSGIITLYGGEFCFLINPDEKQVIHQRKNVLFKNKLLTLCKNK